VQHRPLEAKLPGGALKFVGSRLRHRCRQRSERGEAIAVGADDRRQPVVDAAGQRSRSLSRQFLGRWRAVREHLNVDAGLVHLLDADAGEIVEPDRLLARAAGFGSGVGLSSSSSQ